MPKFENLPKWAQDRIEMLERDLADAHKAVERMVSGSDSARRSATAFVSAPGKGRLDEDGRLFLPRDDVNFLLPGGEISVRVNDEGELYVNGIDHIDIRPEAANAVRIKMRQR